MKKNFTMSQLRIISLLVMLSILITLFGCSGDPPPSPTPIKKPCPTTVISTPQGKKSSPKLVVVLVKEIPGYKGYANQAFDALLRTLPKFMEPGDRIVMLSMEQYNLDSSLILDETVPYVEEPNFSSSPTLPPTIGPLPSPTAPAKGDFMVAVATKDAIKYMEQTKIVATEQTYDYECAIQTWKSTNQGQWDSWKNKRSTALSVFVSTVSQDLEKNKNEGFKLSKNQAFEAIQIGASFLNNECNAYARCSLLIFSDLDDPRYHRPENISISLSGYDVVSLLLHCTYKSQCDERVAFWKDNFIQYGAIDPQFVLNRDVDKFLVSFLGR